MKVSLSDRFRWSRSNNPWWSNWKRDAAYPALAGVLSVVALIAFGFEDEVWPSFVVVAASVVATFLLLPLIELVIGVVRAGAELRNEMIEKQASELRSLKDSGARLAELQVAKLRYEGQFNEIARLVVKLVRGTTTTCRAKVVRIGEEDLSYDASWGDRAELSSTIAPGSSGFINLAMIGEPKGGADVHELLPVRAHRLSPASSTADSYQFHKPRLVSTTKPIRFTLVVSGDAYPDESDRIVVEVGLHYPNESLRAYARVTTFTHLVGGEPT